MYLLAPTPRVFLRPNYLQQGAVGEPHGLVCVIALSSTTQSSSVDLNWNFTSNDNRVTVIPTTITIDSSIGIIYTTVIQFAYLMEGDEGNYTCTLEIDGDSAESTFNLQIISKYNCLILMQCYLTIKSSIELCIPVPWLILVLFPCTYVNVYVYNPKGFNKYEHSN